MQPRIQELAVDERGPFYIYGQTTFVVTYVRGRQSLYEVCEAVWGHWMRWQKRNPSLDPDSVFYWLDVFAVPAASLAQPLHAVADNGALEKVRIYTLASLSTCMYIESQTSGEDLNVTACTHASHQGNLTIDMQVVKSAGGGVLLFVDTIADSPMQSDVWAQWAAWQSARWQKPLDVIRPHQARRVLYLSGGNMQKVRHRNTTLAMCHRQRQYNLWGRRFLMHKKISSRASLSLH